MALETDLTQYLASFVLQPGAATAVVENELASARINLPSAYWRVVRFANGSEGFLGNSYLRFYPADQLIALNHAYCTEQFVPGRLIFGSNGGGEAWMFDLRVRPATVANMPFIPLVDKYSHDFGTFEQFLARLANTGATTVQGTINPNLIGKEIHEINPVVFGGDPLADSNKTYLAPAEYAPYVVWWNRKYREITKL